MAKKLTPEQRQERYNADIALLVEHGYVVSGIKTQALAHRYAQGVRAQLAENQPLPSVKALRGHAPRPLQPIIELPKQGRRLKQRQILAEDTPTGDLWTNNLAYLLTNSPDPVQPDYMLIVRGTVEKGSPTDPDVGEEGGEATYLYANQNKASTKHYLETHPQQPLEIMFNRLRGDIRWLKIDMVGIVYPEPKLQQGGK